MTVASTKKQAGRRYHQKDVNGEWEMLGGTKKTRQECRVHENSKRFTDRSVRATKAGAPMARPYAQTD